MDQHEPAGSFSKSERRARLVTAAGAARRLGLSRPLVDRLCCSGRVVGCRFDPVTWQWMIPLPVRILIGRLR